MELPSGYTKLEYIESTGTQWIDTKVFPTETRILIDAFILEKNTGNDHHIASASWAETGKHEFFNVMRLRADRTGFAARYANGNLRNVEHQGNVYGRHIFDRKFVTAPYTVQVDEATALTLTPSIVGSISCHLPLFAFRRNNGSCSGFISMRLYSCKIWKTIAYEGTLLVRDFIPCKNASGEVGLWDDVNSVFYGNAGTGTFIAGELPTLTAHKTLINGTAYTVQGGKCLVNGTVYNILKGRTLIDGTAWDITFPEPLVMPAKGDLITMNLDGTDRLYRVLKIVDGTTVEVLGMWNLSNSLALDNGNTGTYSGKTLDTYLNATWYSTLSATAKVAIVPKNINQYQYSNSSSIFNESTHSSYANYSTKALKANVGERYIYALDVEDIEMYFGGTGGSASDKTPATFSKTDLLQMFWNQTSTISEFPWLRSASADDSHSAWYVNGYYGRTNDINSGGALAARPAFQIDLSKIDFTIGGGEP